MPNKFIFTDEAGCFTFNTNPNVSKYFILCTAVMEDCGVAAELLSFRRKLAWDGAELGDYFHASTDSQAVRDEVFKVITKFPFTVQATIMEKRKAYPRVRATRERFYKQGYYSHFKYGVADQLTRNCEALVTTASLGTRKERAAFEAAVGDVMRQTQRTKEWRADFMPCHADPCLQVADYCAWAIFRRWESKDKWDVRSYDFIKDRITSEYDLFGPGDQFFY